VVLGSEARAEQTLATDQDNALIFADPDADQADAVADYFQRLGVWICDSLDQIGYRHCDGGIMAKNPQWNQPLAEWKRYVDIWMAEPDAQALSHAKIFFDHRCIYGDEALVEAWWAHITEMLDTRPAFLTHMARNILQYKPPVDLLGRIVTGQSEEGVHTFDIKAAMLPIVNFARLYALQHHVAEANTYDRLEQLTALDVVQAATTREITEAYTHLMQLRFRHQVARLKAAQPPDNAIDPSALSQIDLGILKLTFSQISTIQKKVSFDFRGAA
jgi:CBS domain-containing protein